MIGYWEKDDLLKGLVHASPSKGLLHAVIFLVTTIVFVPIDALPFIVSPACLSFSELLSPATPAVVCFVTLIDEYSNAIDIDHVIEGNCKIDDYRSLVNRDIMSPTPIRVLTAPTYCIVLLP
jgi:hypothetical protein